MRRNVERNKNMSYQTNTISRVNREIKRWEGYTRLYKIALNTSVRAGRGDAIATL